MSSRIAGWFGIQRDESATIGVRLRWRFWLFLGIVFFGLCGYGLMAYSESPTFCHSCHIMDPYYDAWEASSHNEVACVECHYPPTSHGKLLWKKVQALNQVFQYVTDTYSSRPFAEVSDSSCLRANCHATNLLKGQVVSGKKIHFDHGPHLDPGTIGRELRCVSCHSQITVGKHIEISYEACFLCHFKGRSNGRDLEPLGGCLGCHDLPEASFKVGNMSYNHADFVAKRGIPCANCHLDVVSGHGDAPRERCLPCHAKEEDLARHDEVSFLHETHVATHNVACFHCHGEIQHGRPRAAQARVAKLDEPVPYGHVTPKKEDPHGAALLFDCSFCHQEQHGGQLLMYSGRVEGLGLPQMPSPMFEAEVDCVGCHYQNSTRPGQEFVGFTFEASDHACVKCHGPEFEGIWEDTQKEFATTLARLDDKLAAVSEAVSEADPPLPLSDSRRARLEQARRWHSFVKYSKGEHNPYLGAVALRKEDQLLDVLAGELDAEVPDLAELPLLSGGYCASLCHARVGVQVPPAEVMSEDFGSMMPHGEHAGMMSCVTCHEIGRHKEVPLKDDAAEVCMECH